MSLMSTPSPPTGGLLPSGHEWDFSRTGVPWLDYLIDLVVVTGVLVGAGLLVYSRVIAPQLKEIHKNSATAAEQTANSHGDAPNPNLRDDLDAKFAGVAEGLAKLDTGQTHLATMLARVEEAQRRQDRELARIQEAQAADRAETRRVREALDEHISEKRDFAPRLADVERELKTQQKKTP